MEFEGKVLKILEPTSGQTARGTWERQVVVFEQPNKQYGKEIAVTFMNKAQEVSNLRVGESYIISFDIESREYQGRWYTDVRAWRVQSTQQTPPPPVHDLPPILDEAPVSSSMSAGVIDDIPF